MRRSKTLSIAIALITLIGVERFTRLQTDGFRISKASTPYLYPFVDNSLSDCPDNCLDQPFFFFDSGVQSYVFIGKDNQTILKLFKHHHLGPPSDFLAKYFPHKWVKNLLRKREKRIIHMLESAQIAHEKLPSLTGVFYTHLSKTHNQLGTITLYDKIGIAHTLDLDQTEFLLQKKGVTAKEVLDKHFQEGEIEKAIEVMEELILCQVNRSLLGIRKKDGHLLRNCGLIEDRAAELDIGSFVYSHKPNTPETHTKVEEKARKQLLQWIEKKHPEHLSRCKRRLSHKKVF